MNLSTDFDIGIIGAGPAGSALAAYLGQAGYSCIVLEKELFPRPHVGESLVPASHRVLRDIGMLDQMDIAGFPKKYGAAWTSAGSSSKVYDHDWEGMPEDCRVDIRFDDREMEGDKNHTWHVDREKFDHLLLQNAEKKGATVIQEARVGKVQFNDGQSPEITFKKDGVNHSIKVKLVVDASGRNTLLGNQLKIKVKDPNFDQYAIHTWFKDYDRGAVGAKADFIYIHFLPMANTWLWQIPITDDITSIGLVTQKKFFAGSKSEREAFFWDCVEKYPEIYTNLKKAEQMRPFKAEGDYSYAMTDFIGEGWALVGDAARFMDPIFSSGVSVALNSARYLFYEIDAKLKGGFDKPVFSKEDLAEYDTVIRRGTKNWYDFISLYYRLNVVFTWFVHNPKYRLEVLELLSGDVYHKDEPEVLVAMREFVEKIEQNPNHVLHPLLKEVSGVEFEQPA